MMKRNQVSGCQKQTKTTIKQAYKHDLREAGAETSLQKHSVHMISTLNASDGLLKILKNFLEGQIDCNIPMN